MRGVVQRVHRASVMIEGNPVSAIGTGLLVLIGIQSDDRSTDIDYMRDKLLGLRIFDDEAGVMNRSVTDIGGSILLVSQFTLCGDARKGRRPSYSEAMEPEHAAPFFSQFVASVKERYPDIQTGLFGADMTVSLENAGPVTILLDSRKLF